MISKGHGLCTTSGSISCTRGRISLLMETRYGIQKFSIEYNIREVDSNKDTSTEEYISKSEGHTK